MKARKWLLFSILCLVSWGVFGFLSKLSSGKLQPGEMQVLFTFGTIPLLIPAWLRSRKKLDRDRAGVAMGMLTGLVAALANLALFAALKHGSASVVAPFTALYPVVTFGLAALALKERMNRYQYLGVLLAVVAIVLLSL